MNCRKSNRLFASVSVAGIHGVRRLDQRCRGRVGLVHGRLDLRAHDGEQAGQLVHSPAGAAVVFDGTLSMVSRLVCYSTRPIVASSC